MLKLTQHDTKTAIYISAHALVTNGAIWKLQHIGSGLAIGGKEFWVTETPEQIMAMDEMVKALNPLVSHNDPSHTMSFGPNWPYSSTTYGALPQNVSQCIISHHCPNWKGN